VWDSKQLARKGNIMNILNKLTIGEIVTIAIPVLLFAASLGVAFYEINSLKDEIIQKQLEIGQLKQKLILSNNLAVDFIYNSSISQKDKITLKNKYDEINAKWLQYLKGGDVQGAAAFSDTPIQKSD
jgi:hypothetical protein